MVVFFNLLPLVVLFGGAVFGQDECPCTLEDAEHYSGKRWMCHKLGLSGVPGQCWSVQSENVTEVMLSENDITTVHNIDFTGMSDVLWLHLDNNKIEYVDPTSLDDMADLEVLHLEWNGPFMDVPSMTLRNKPELKEFVIASSDLVELPSLTSASKLQKLDVRSSAISKFPRPLFNSNLAPDSGTFLLVATANLNLKEIAADSLLPIPAGATVNLDTWISIWCADDTEKAEVVAKNWVTNIDLNIALKVCTTDGSPYDPASC